MTAPKVEMVCSQDESHDVTDYEKSNKNWKVIFATCPVCGSQVKHKLT